MGVLRGLPFTVPSALSIGPEIEIFGGTRGALRRMNVSCCMVDKGIVFNDEYRNRLIRIGDELTLRGSC